MEQDLPVPDTGRETLLLLDIRYLPLVDYFRRFYPSARIELARGPDGVPIYLRAHLGRADLDATTGLRARVFGAGERARVVSAPERTALAPDVVRVEWDGSLRLSHGGRYDSPCRRGPNSLWTTEPGGAPVPRPGAPRDSPRPACSGAREAHAIRVGDPGRKPGDVPTGVLFRMRQPAEGLTTNYYPNKAWKGPPLFDRVTPVLFLAWSEPDPIPGEFSARFVGFLRVTKPGVYGFQIDADDGATLAVDGRSVGECVINRIRRSRRRSD